jgi:cation diffusion facilitator CzcD-associated flavoprotein CzcO
VYSIDEVAIVGAGPYGLSLAAYLQRQGVGFRIFGKPMDSWLHHMPDGMLLKSDGFASCLYDPDDAYPLARYCAENGIRYADRGDPIALETFCKYGLAFQQRFVPTLEPADVATVTRTGDGFVLRLEDGTAAFCRRVVLAVGVGPFRRVAAPLECLPAGRVSHSFDPSDLSSFVGRRVAIVGGGASAIDTATLIGERGGEASLISRRAELKFGGRPMPGEPSVWRRLRHPPSGLGPSWRSRLSTDAPLVFHWLPASWRVEIVRRHLGPAAGWPMRERMLRSVKLHLHREVADARISGDDVELALRGPAGAKESLRVDHVIAATGFQVDVARLALLDATLRAEIATVDEAPTLSSHFESSARGLYFVGPAAAVSFGPLLRFAFGARFAARRLSTHLRRAAEAGASATEHALRLTPESGS